MAAQDLLQYPQPTELLETSVTERRLPLVSVKSSLWMTLQILQLKLMLLKQVSHTDTRLMRLMLETLRTAARTPCLLRTSRLPCTFTLWVEVRHSTS